MTPQNTHWEGSESEKGGGRSGTRSYLFRWRAKEGRTNFRKRLSVRDTERSPGGFGGERHQHILKNTELLGEGSRREAKLRRVKKFERWLKGRVSSSVLKRKINLTKYRKSLGIRYNFWSLKGERIFCRTRPGPKVTAKRA